MILSPFSGGGGVAMILSSISGGGHRAILLTPFLGEGGDMAQLSLPPPLQEESATATQQPNRWSRENIYIPFTIQTRGDDNGLMGPGWGEQGWFVFVWWQL